MNKLKPTNGFDLMKKEFDILNLRLSDFINNFKPKEGLGFMRHLLGSIDLSDVKEEEMSEGERKEYCAAISAVWPRLEKDMKQFMHVQLMYSSNQAEDWEKVMVGRGSFNGICLLFEHWKKAHLEHIANSKPKEQFDEHSPIGEV